MVRIFCILFSGFEEVLDPSFNPNIIVETRTRVRADKGKFRVSTSCQITKNHYVRAVTPASLADERYYCGDEAREVILQRWIWSPKTQP
jgi:hypothetical protein